MLIKLKVKRYITWFLVLLLILQFLPGTFNNIECVDGHTQNSTIIFSNRAINTDIAFLTSDGRKTTFHSISADIYDCLAEPVSIADISENEPIYNTTPADLRKEIRQSISNYFHGSKYKENCLCI